MAKEKSFESVKNFWSSRRILSVFLIIFGLIFGMLLQHYYIEPLIGDNAIDELRFCKTQQAVLNEENEYCYQKVHDINALLRVCSQTLDSLG
jgi:hypothetical protein